MNDIEKNFSNITVLVTRAKHQAKFFASSLEKQGFNVILFPTIKISPPETEKYIQKTIEILEVYDYLLFTSINGVHYFMKFVEKYCGDFSVLQNLSIIAIGEKTKSLIETCGLKVSTIPSSYNAEALAEQLHQMPMKNKRVLFPRGKLARKLLIKELKRMSVDVDSLIVYQTTLPQNHSLIKEVIDYFEQSRIDVVTFTSPSTVRNFLILIGEEQAKGFLQNGAKTAVIGPTTKRAAEKFDIRVHIVAEQTMVSSLTEAVVDYYEKRSIPQSL